MSYVVKAGDCMASIALRHGFAWDYLWGLPENAELKNARKDPFVLYPGDQVFIPAVRQKQQSAATDQTHVFKLNSVPARVRIVVTDERDRPRPNQAYKLTIDDRNFEGRTDANGAIEHPIWPNAKGGRLLVGEDEEQQEYTVTLGHLDPLDEISGLQGRLLNLGYYTGPVDGTMNSETRTALLLFQDKYGLTPTVQNDFDTQAKLKELAGC